MVENLAKDMPSMLGYEVRAALRRPLPAEAPLLQSDAGAEFSVDAPPAPGRTHAVTVSAGDGSAALVGSKPSATASPASAAPRSVTASLYGELVVAGTSEMSHEGRRSGTGAAPTASPPMVASNIAGPAASGVNAAA